MLDHVRQRHRLRPARPAGERLRHGDLVLRRLRVRHGRRARSRTPTAGYGATYLETSTSTRSATPSCRRSSSPTT
jgi:hypothetical protein